ncbi:MAG: nuclear transport factor 2 family protein [Devosia sp.]
MSDPAPITDAPIRAWVEAYRQAWIDRDPDQIVQIFTADAHYQEDHFKPGLMGVEAIRTYWQVIVESQQRDVDFSYELLATRGRTAFIHWTAHFTWLPINSIMELDAIAQIRFAETPGQNGLLAEAWDEWIDIREA